MAELFQLADGGSGGRARNRKAKTLVSSGLRHDERVDADNFAPDVHQRASGIPWIDWRVRLDVDERRIGIDLSRHGRHQAMRQAVAQADRASECKHGFALTDVRIGRQRQRRQLHVIDLQQRQVEFAGNADDARGNERRSPGQRRCQGSIRVAGGQHDLNPPRATDNVGVCQDVAFWIDDEPRSHGPLSADDERRVRPAPLRSARHSC